MYIVDFAAVFFFLKITTLVSLYRPDRYSSSHIDAADDGPRTLTRSSSVEKIVVAKNNMKGCAHAKHNPSLTLLTLLVVVGS